MTPGAVPSAVRRPGRADLEAFGAAFDRAAGAGRLRVHHLRLAGRAVLLRIAGADLDAMVAPPLTHLAHDGGDAPPALRIDLWDEGDTGIPGPGCRVDETLGVDGEVSVSRDGRLVDHRRARSRCLYDRDGGRIIGWSRFQGRACLYERGRPLHVPLALWHADVGAPVAHAALVAEHGRGVLLPGMGGSGKSTTALCCLEAGLSYLGDDYTALEERAEGGFVGHSLYGSSHLEPHHLRRFPRLRDHARPPQDPREDKSLVLLPALYPGGFLPAAPIAAIALPRVADIRSTRARRCGAAEALRALAPSTILMIPGRGAAGLAALARLVAAVPAYRLELGRDLDSIAPAVRGLLEEVPTR